MTEKLTPWFSGNVKPARRGIYEVRNNPDGFLHPRNCMFLTTRRRFFDGQNWRAGWMWEAISIFGQHPEHQWRGLTSDPMEANHG